VHCVCLDHIRVAIEQWLSCCHTQSDQLLNYAAYTTGPQYLQPLEMVLTRSKLVCLTLLLSIGLINADVSDTCVRKTCTSTSAKQCG
jgi:hypothetical protein